MLLGAVDGLRERADAIRRAGRSRRCRCRPAARGGCRRSSARPSRPRPSPASTSSPAARIARRPHEQRRHARRGRAGAAPRPSARRAVVDQLGAGVVSLVACPWRAPARAPASSCGCSRDRRGVLLHVRPQRLRLGLAAERRRAGQALVEHAGERVAVRARVDRPRRGSARARGSRACRRSAPCSVESPPTLLGHAEVGQVGVPVVVDEDVARA